MPSVRFETNSVVGHGQHQRTGLPHKSDLRSRATTVLDDIGQRFLTYAEEAERQIIWQLSRHGPGRELKLYRLTISNDTTKIANSWNQAQMLKFGGMQLPAQAADLR